MADDPLKAGETVRVKSGGPVMTIKVIEGDEAICTWFDGTKKKESRFRLVTLERDDGRRGNARGPIPIGSRASHTIQKVFRHQGLGARHREAARPSPSGRRSRTQTCRADAPYLD